MCTFVARISETIVRPIPRREVGVGVVVVVSELVLVQVMDTSSWCLQSCEPQRRCEQSPMNVSWPWHSTSSSQIRPRPAPYLLLIVRPTYLHSQEHFLSFLSYTIRIVDFRVVTASYRVVIYHWLHYMHAQNRHSATTLTCRALHGDAPQYLRQFTSIADIPSPQRLRSSTSDELCVPVVRLPTVGHRAFPVAGARIWNDLPADVTSAPSLPIFRKRLKLHLFRQSYPGLVLWINCFICVVLVVAACYLGHLKKILDWLIDWLNELWSRHSPEPVPSISQNSELFHHFSLLADKTVLVLLLILKKPAVSAVFGDIVLLQKHLNFDELTTAWLLFLMFRCMRYVQRPCKVIFVELDLYDYLSNKNSSNWHIINRWPEAETEARDSGVRVVKSIVTNCPPDTVVIDFQTSFVWQRTASQSHSASWSELTCA